MFRLPKDAGIISNLLTFVVRTTQKWILTDLTPAPDPNVLQGNSRFKLKSRATTDQDGIMAQIGHNDPILGPNRPLKTLVAGVFKWQVGVPDIVVNTLHETILR
jgi:hypothetical protein